MKLKNIIGVFFFILIFFPQMAGAFTVTPSAGSGGTISPSTPQSVSFFGSTSFTVTPNSGYAISSVSGCGGSLSGSTYTTGAITGNCTVTASFVHTYTVTPSAGTGGSISPSTAQTVNSGATTSFTVTPNTGYGISSVGGTCGGSLSGNTYTTNTITGNCTVTASFIQTFTVTPSAGSGGSLSPSTAQTVNSGSNTSFTVTPNSGYGISSVSGCNGSLSGNTYTTGAITGNCTVSASFVHTYTVTPSAGSGGSLSPSTAQTVNSGSTTSFTVTPNSGYSISSVSGCNGSLSGSTFTTGSITGNCTVTASFAHITYTVTPSAGSGGSISPSSAQTVNSGSTASFTVTPNSGYIITSMGGTCGGNLSGNTYTTNTITGSCTVIASFGQNGACGSSNGQTFTSMPSSNLCSVGTATTVAGSGPWTWSCQSTNGGTTASCSANIQTYTVTPSAGSGGSMSPSTAQTVNYGSTTSFTVTPNTGYSISSVSGCNGSLSGSTFTTGSITGNCTVTASFAHITYTVTPSAGSGGSISPSTAQTVNSGSTTAFTVTPNTGYSIVSVSGCSGSLSGSTYTTGAITGSCTVTASFGQNGACGSSNGQTFISKPSSNLCSVGTATTVAGSGPWTWSCQSTNGGTTASCSANIQTYTVTPSAGFGGSISPSTAQTVGYNSAVSFTVTPYGGYSIASVSGCGGSLSGSTYTTGAITGNCTVSASFIQTYTVTPSAGSGGSISPSTAQTVNSGGTTSFTVTPNSGYSISSVSGCNGSLSGSTYTTGSITGNCTVSASFVHTYTVTPSAGSGGTISPSTAQTVNSGATTSFTVTPNTGYNISSVGGTCGGSLSGNTYTTNAITGSCTVTASFVQTFTVTPSAGTGGSISPSTAQTVNSGATTSFTVTPNSGYGISSVSGCGGSLSGSTYTTGAITGNCTVTASFANYTVTPSAGTGGSLSPSTAQTVASGSTKSFTVTANNGYTIVSVSGCGGSLSGSTYTTGAITGNCTVTATFGQNGACGTSNGQSFISAPSSNLCSVGTATTVAGSGPWTWSCQSTNGGTTASCSASVQTYSVTPSPGAGGYMNPSSVQTVGYNSTVTFSVSAYGGYSIASVSGCNGTLSGNQYTTGPITGNCTVTATFVGTYTVTPSASPSWAGSISPSRAQIVNGGSTVTFTVTPGYGYQISSVTGCGGVLSGNMYTTGAISSNCTVTATFTSGRTTTTTTPTTTTTIPASCYSQGYYSSYYYCAFQCSGQCTQVPGQQCYQCVTGTSTSTTTTTTGTSTSSSSSTTTTTVPFTGSGYCDVPASLATVVPPNILFVIDSSGSMTEQPYQLGEGPNGGAYSSSTTYEGYFTPTANYSYSSSCPAGSGGCWQQTSSSPTSSTCSSPSTSHVYTGNCLNYYLMEKTDLIRWAVTGGKPSTCNSNTFTVGNCDVELWQNSSNSVSTVCNSTGCVLQDANSDKVFVPWARINNGLAFVFENLSTRPRMGVTFFSNGKVNPYGGQVYIGDSTGAGSVSGTYPYQNFITALNAYEVNGDTPTGYAMWDALNYFEQNSPQYGGFAVQTSSTDTADEWKNPMYQCDSTGSNCVLTSCAKNFVILMSDGLWNTPSCSSSSPTVTVGGVSYSAADPVQPAYLMHMGFTNGPTGVSTSVSNVYTVGLFLSVTDPGVQALENVAMYGSFNEAGKTSPAWPGSLSGYPQTACNSSQNQDIGCTGKGSGCTALPTPSSDWSNSGNGLPDTFFNTSNASDIQNNISGAVLDALRRAASGTAASLLTTSQGSGAILTQAVFYPQRQFGSSVINWTSEMQTLWYYLDPSLQSSVIMENTNGQDILNLSTDDVLNFRFDTTSLQTVVDRCTFTTGGTCSNSASTYVSTVDIGSVNALWQAGSILWSRDATAYPRTLYTNYSGAFTSFTGLNPSDSTVQTTLQASSSTQATNLINYIAGIDQTGFRNRTVTIGGNTGVWKLGDIVDSTPQVEGASPLNQYNLQPPQGYADTSYGPYSTSLDYLTRDMVYASANDGMMHAFDLGTVDTTTNITGNQKATLCDDTLGDGKCDQGQTFDSTLGTEDWAFIPNNALPYLTYITNPNYCHLYYVDGPLYLFDASINMLADCATSNYYDCKKQTTVNANNNLTLNETSWQTVLIGSMGLGGASAYSGGSCTQCVTSPLAGGGLSSYFALNVTEQHSPSLMWEFSNPALGFSMSGPAVVRISSTTASKPDNTKNGHWFAVFASGPTGPIDATSKQFMGRSDQDLQLFVVDLPTGTLLRTIDTGIPNAFVTSVFNSPIDTDRWNSGSAGFYQDNVFYIGYVKQCPSTNTSCTDTTWTNGGVLRVMTKEDPNPANWVVSKVIDDIGPVTTSVTKLQDTTNGNLWLYFGTGRFFYKTLSGIDDPNSQRNIYGIVEPCYNDGAPNSTNTMDPTCTSSVSSSALTNRTTNNSTAAAAPAPGWYINLALPSGSSLAERVITNPLASPNGIVYFTTFAPSSDLCTFGGNTYLWAVGYNTGTSGIDVTKANNTTTQTKAVSSLMQGKALIQVSTGSIVQENLANTFASSRTSSAITGQPPIGQGLAVITSPQPIKQIMHIRER